MSNEEVESPGAALTSALDPEAIAQWLSRQRWYATKSRQIASLHFEEAILLESGSPLVLALAQTGFATGTHELYQLPLSFVAPGELGGREPMHIAEVIKLALGDHDRDHDEGRVESRK